LDGSPSSAQYFIAAIRFHKARQTFTTRWRSETDTAASISAIRPVTAPVTGSLWRKCSGWMVFGSQSANYRL
jgi:hypothetical protein